MRKDSCAHALIDLHGLVLSVDSWFTFSWKLGLFFVFF